MKRLVGIDYGIVRIGLAVSDERRFLATPLCCLPNDKTFPEKLKAALSCYSIEHFVVGLPLLMNGQESEICLKTKAFCSSLEQLLQIPTVFWDERLTSSQVEKSLKELGTKRKKRASLSDMLAACVILQSYLDFKGASL